MSGPEFLAFFVVVGGGAYVVRPVALAIAKRIAGEHRKPELDPEDRDELFAELQHVRQEVAELAERMDFAERMIAKPRE